MVNLKFNVQSFVYFIYSFFFLNLWSLWFLQFQMFIFLEGVWQCSSGCFSNNLLCRNACQWFFLFLKNYFWHQHIKTIQNVQTILNFSKDKFNFFWERGLHCVSKHVLNIWVSKIERKKKELMNNHFSTSEFLMFGFNKFHFIRKVW